METGHRRALRGGRRRTIVLFAGVLVAAGCNDPAPDATPATARVRSAAGSDADASELAAELARLDPGARLGVSTIVVSTPGATVHGTPRLDFIVAVADNQVIVAGDGDDQLGTLAAGTIIEGGEGNDLLYGHGADAELDGGPGADLITGHGARVTVHAGAGDEVHVHDADPDRILCGADTDGLVVRADASDEVDPACGAVDTSAPPSSSIPTSTVQGFAAAAPAQVTGSGTNENPFVAPCTTVGGRPTVCNVEGFPAQTTGGFWWSDTIPAYRCPESYPYLYRHKYTPAFTVIPIGVEIRQVQWPWPVGINISSESSKEAPGVRGDRTRFTGTRTGNGVSSATNWSDNPTWYQVVLHCTDDPAYGTNLTR